MTEDSSRGGLGEDAVPVGYSGHRGGAGLEVWDYQAVAVIGRGGVVSEGCKACEDPEESPGERQH